jgi:hypothetical protein
LTDISTIEKSISRDPQPSMYVARDRPFVWFVVA